MSEIDLWSRIERSQELVLANSAEGDAATAKTPEEKAADKRRFRRVIRLLDALSLVFWAYVVAKVFLVDVDRHLVRAIAPSYEHLVDYRVLFYAGVVALVLVVRRRWLLGIGYILAFPILLVAWKIPAFFVRRKSWPLFLGTLQTLFTALSEFRYNFVSKTLALFAAVFILTLDATGLLRLSALYLFVLLALNYWRTLVKIARSPSFVKLQREKIGDVINSPIVRQLETLNEDAKRADLQHYSQAQLNEVANAITYGIVINRGLYYWSYQLERYRRNVIPGLIAAAISYAWLFIGTVFSFALINFAVLKIDQSNFDLSEAPVSFLRMVLYSFSRLFMNDGGGVGASSDLAYGIQLVEAVAGVILLVGLVANLLVTARRERDEAELKELVAELKRRAREHEDRFREEFYVSVEEARRRLEELGVGFTRLLAFFTSAVPPDFFDDVDQTKRPSD